jgi:hypothetical protein
MALVKCSSRRLRREKLALPVKTRMTLKLVHTPKFPLTGMGIIKMNEKEEESIPNLDIIKKVDKRKKTDTHMTVY